MSNKKTYLLILVALLVGIGGYFFPRVTEVVERTAGAVITPTNQTSLTGLNLSYTSTPLDTVSGTFIHNGLREVVSSGSCATATTTLFAIKPPSGATSTATINFITTTAANATSSNLTVGTSTVPVGLAASGVSASFANALTVGTSSQMAFSSGIRVGSVGQLDAGAGSFRTILVGPSDYVSAFATSTFTGLGAAGYIGGLGSSCTYKITWTD